jgi:circadian clock protein KaiC
MEESRDQLVRNMRSVGINLEPYLEKGLLTIHASLPTLTGLEMYLVTMHELVKKFSPDVVIVDPVSNLVAAGVESDAKLMFARMLDFLKGKNITSLFTYLSSAAGIEIERMERGISALMDTWILLSNFETNGDHKRAIRVVKSRGMANSSLSYLFRLSDGGIEIVDVVKDKGDIFVRKDQKILGDIK